MSNFHNYPFQEFNSAQIDLSMNMSRNFEEQKIPNQASRALRVAPYQQQLSPRSEARSYQNQSPTHVFPQQPQQQFQHQPQDTLFLGDLAIETTESVLIESFQRFGEIVDVRVKCAASLGPEGGVKNLGYGFLKFANPESASAAMREMDGYVLKGRPLRVGWAAKGKSSESKQDRRTAQVLTSFMGKDVSEIIIECVLMNSIGQIQIAYTYFLTRSTSGESTCE